MVNILPFNNGQYIAIAQIFSERDEVEATKYVASLFHKEGEVKFKLDGQHEISCTNQKESVYVTDECKAANAVLRQNNVSGMSLGELYDKNREVVQKIYQEEKAPVASTALRDGAKSAAQIAPSAGRKGGRL